VKRLLPVLLLLAVIPYFVGLGASSIWDANEAYYVETPREMLESGDYINPSFNYEPRFNKPVLSYWMVAGLYQLFGVSVGVQRLAIAASAMVMIGGAFVIARAASPATLAPWLAALGLAAGPRFFMFSRRILVDMAMTAMMTLTLVFFVLAERYPERRRLFLALMYVSVGLGVLTKGPVAAVIPMLVFAAYLAAHRELRRLREMMIPAGVLIALAVAAPWYVALYQQHGWTYITEFFVGENVGRFTETVGVQARGPGFYLPVVLTDALPWSLLLPAVLFTWKRERRASAGAADPQRRLRTLLLLWIAVIVLFFSLSQTKQDLYIFPIVVAVAALGGDWLARVIGSPEGGPYTTNVAAAFRPPTARDGVPDRGSAAEGRWLTGALVLLAVVLVAAGAFVLYVFGAAQTLYQVAGARLSGGIMLAGGVALAILAGRGHRAAVVVALTVLIAFNWVLAVRALPAFEQYKPVVPLARVIEREATRDDLVAHFDVALPSMVFYLRRHIDVWIDSAAFVQQMRSGRTVYAVLPAHRYEELKEQFGVETCVIARHATSDIRLRSILEMTPPPEVLLVTTRCRPVPNDSNVSNDPNDPNDPNEPKE
jgi:4-amino-4-deoxy-L-arabinose transferase-like glycosyltransferase